MDKQYTFEQALRTREFEDDAPNFTPRISGILRFGEEGFNYIDEYADSDTERGKKLRAAICDELHLASLEFQSLDGIVAAIGLPQDWLCTYCWNGKE